MSFEIKERAGKFCVVDTTTQRIRGTYDNEDDADDRKDDLEFKIEVRDRLSRMPVTQMTAEEKAAEYDRLIAAKNDQPPENDPKIPPKIDQPAVPPKTKRSSYWGDQLEN